MLHEDMLKVEVGDVICDCRFRHLKVIEVEDDMAVRRGLFQKFDWLLPTFLYEFLYNRRPTEVVDKNLTLEDGAQCSAMHCADVVPHLWEHDDEVA